MGLARFFFQWVIDYAATESPDISGTNVVLFSAAAVGATMLAFRIFDGVTDPIAGIISDSWVAKGRQRRGLLPFAFLIPPVGLALVFMPTHTMDSGLKWALLVAGMLVFFIGYTFYAIPYWSLIEDYSAGDESERRALSNILGAGILIATGIGFVGSPFLVEAYGFGTSAIIFAVPAAVMMILPYFAAPPASKSPRKPKVVDGATPNVWHNLRGAFKHRRFMAVLVMFAGSQMSFTMMTAAAPFIAVDLLQGEKSDVGLILGPLLGVAIPAFLITPWISRKFGWEKAVMFASIGLGVVYLTTAGLGAGIIGTPLTTAMILFALGGPMVAVLLGLEGEAITACADEKGGDAVSIYFGVYNFLVKAMNGVAIFAAGLLADQVRGGLGAQGVRYMAMVAGGSLFIGVVAYFFLRVKTPPMSPKSAA